MAPSRRCSFRLLRRAALAVALALAAGPLHAGVLVVDASGGGDYTTIQAAVDAAAEGDVILVRPGGVHGVYDETEIVSKSVHVVGLGSQVQLWALDIRLLSADQDVGVSGLGIGTMRVVNCQGSVRVQDCVTIGYDGVEELEGLVITSSLDVVLTDSQFYGGFGNTDESCCPEGHTGLRAAHSSIVSHRSTFTGGDGVDGCQDTTIHDGAGTGGLGVDATHSFLFFEGGNVEGGRGGSGQFDGAWCCWDGPGGDGMHLNNQSAAHATNGFFTEAGIPGNSDCPEWPDLGEDLVVDGTASYQQWNELQRTITVPAAAESTDHVQLVVRGRPGDKVWFPRALHGRHVFSMLAGGVLQLQQLIPGSSVLLGVVPASGILTRTISVTDLAMGLIDRSVHFQLYVRDSAGFRRVGESGLVSVVSVPLQ